MPKKSLLVLFVVLFLVLLLVPIEGCSITLGTRQSGAESWRDLDPGADSSDRWKKGGGDGRIPVIVDASSAVVLRMDGGALSGLVAERMAASLRECDGLTNVTIQDVSMQAFEPLDKPLADVIVLVEVEALGMRDIGVSRSDQLTVRIAIGETPVRAGTREGDHWRGFMIEVGGDVETKFSGFQTPFGRRQDFADLSLEMLSGGLEELEWAPGPVDQSLRSKAAAVDQSPLIKGVRSSKVYSGWRANGDFEALFRLESEDCYYDSVERLVAQAKAEGWEWVTGVRSVEGRSKVAEMVRGDQRLQLLPFMDQGAVFKAPTRVPVALLLGSLAGGASKKPPADD